jgi:deoxyribodipyrimidine photo-lyase
MQKINFFWFRRDLRLEDNAGVYHALKSSNPVLSLFIFDKNILDDLEDKADARVSFIHQEISRLQEELKALGSSLLVRHGNPADVWKELTTEYKIGDVYTNHDFEPYARDRDASVQQILQELGINFHSFKDHVIFEKNEIVKDDGSPYTVFTPYSRKWLATLHSRKESDDNGAETLFYLNSYPTEK